jgi:hypothetical protein
MFVYGHHDAARDTEIACQRSRGRQDRSGRQAALLNRRAQLLLQLRGQTPASRPIESHEKVRGKPRLTVIGLLRKF